MKETWAGITAERITGCRTHIIIAGAFWALLLVPGCSWDLNTPLNCGDGDKADEEACDGTDLGGKTCLDRGYGGGALACTSKCELDWSGCYRCGDGVKAEQEVCDGTNLGGKTCKGLQTPGGATFAGGTLKCKSSCLALDTSGCYRCGDGTINGTERCDGAALGGKTCEGLFHEGGKLACKSDCSYDVTGCYRCGDKKLSGSDECDGADLGGKTCKDLGYEGGTIKCRSDCKLDKGACYKCGDGKITGSDKCDGTDLCSKTCKDFGFQGGLLACKTDCSWFDTSGCYKCGDNKITGTDVCDGAALGSKTCVALGWEGGTLSCKSDCSWYDTAGCYRCGDGKKNGKEACDLSDLGGATCGTIGYVKGALSCGNSCTLDSSNCSPYKWIWAHRFGGSGSDNGKQVDVDINGNVLVAGTFEMKGDFGKTTLSSSGYGDVFVAKLDSGGNYKWAIRAGGTYKDEIAGVSSDCKGNIYAAGSNSGGASFGSFKTTSLGYDVWVARISPSGGWDWVVTAGGSSNDKVKNLAVDSAGNVFITGYFNKTATFGSHTITSKGGTDIFVAKLDSTGKFVWAKSFGSTDNDYGVQVQHNNSGQIYLGGEYRGTMAVGGASLTNASDGTNDFFVAKLDASGAVLWSRSAGGTWVDYLRGLALDAAGNVYLSGMFSKSMTMGSMTLTPAKKYANYPYDIFLAKMDPTGKWIWAIRGGGTYTISTMGLEVDAKGNSYLPTFFESVATFGKLSVLGMARDWLVVKVDPSGKPLWGATAGGPGWDAPSSVKLDGKKHLYLTGNCSDWAQFGKTSHLAVKPHTALDGCVAKLQVAP